MENLIVANWKMNPVSQKEAENIFNGIKDGIGEVNAEVVICPPFAWLAEARRWASEGGCIVLGAQNCFYEEKGAFTGEISPAMLKDLGVKYVIIGHSERRKYFGETDEIANKKLKAVLNAGLSPILCIGETSEERDAGKKNEVLERQIKTGFAGIENFKFQISNLNLAYEPVWAIGTGNNCGVEETKESINFILEILSPVVRTTGLRILYGGSVKGENSGAYIKEAGANGLLVGGASLNAEEFVKIIKSAE